MSRDLNIGLNSFAFGVQLTSAIIGVALNSPFLIVWCAAFVVYHAIRLRGLLKSGVEA